MAIAPDRGEAFDLDMAKPLTVYGIKHFGLQWENNVERNIIRMVESLYNNTSCGVLYNDGNIGRWFRTTVGAPGIFTSALFIQPILGTNNVKCTR